MNRSGFLLFGLLLAFVAKTLGSLALAATPLVPAEAGALPVEISATQSLEWNRKDKTYTARTNAVAKQGTFEVHCDTLIARYSEDSGAADITQLEALNNVVISSPPYTGFGDRAVYDIAQQWAVLTGVALKITTPEETLTAKDSIVFLAQDNSLTANGAATAVRGTDRLSADVMTAFFTQDQAGKTTLKRIDADGHVIIKTEKETATGDHGIYDVVGGQAVLTGKVFVYQGENKLEGTRATVDLKTGISQLFADDAATDGRVKGIFYPKSKPQTQQQKAP